MDASFLKAMVNSPRLPNAAATRWISYIQLFDLEYKHISAEQHKVPDGLSRRAHAKEDSDNTELGEDYDQIGPFIDSSMHPIQYIPPPIWVKILQLKKADIHLIAAAKSFEQDYEPYLVAVTSGIAKRGEEAQDLQLHPHHVLDKKKPDYWNNIIEYLQTLKVPEEVEDQKSFIQTVRKYFIYKGFLW